MSHELNEAKADAARLETAADRLKAQLADIDARRDATERDLRKAQREHGKAQERIRAISQEPAARAELDSLTERLRSRLAQPPEFPGDKRSPTRERVRNELDALQTDTRLSTADRISCVKGLAREFAERRHRDSNHYAATERR